MPHPYRNKHTIWLFIYLFYLGALTLSPFDFSPLALWERTRLSESRSYTDFLVNILGFVPLGILLFIGGDSTNSLRKLIRATVFCGVASLVIEGGQLFLSRRVPSLADLLANTFGGAMGFWAAHHLAGRRWVLHLKRYRRLLVLSVLAGYLGGLVGFFLWVRMPQRLAGWDASYPLMIGNEATRDRPWLGTILLLALYDRALGPEEIQSQFHAGPHAHPSVYLDGAPVVFYPFRDSRGTRVQDRSSISPPLDLEITDPAKVVWLPDGGLNLTGPTLLRTQERPRKIFNRFTRTHTFSVVTWIRPQDALQSGPARVVSLSLNTNLRNFTLAQQGSEIHFRVRNPGAGPNGTRLDLRTRGLKLASRPTHLVALYDQGTELLYVNGVLFSDTVRRNSLTVIARVLEIDAASPWQRGLLVILLLGPAGGCLFFLSDRGSLSGVVG